MKTSMILAALLAGLPGCVTSNEVFLADGSKGYNIGCGGAVQNMGACLEKAGQICGERGYDVVTREGSAAPYAIAGGAANQYNAGFTAQSGTIISRNLFVRCK